MKAVCILVLALLMVCGCEFARIPEPPQPAATPRASLTQKIAANISGQSPEVATGKTEMKWLAFVFALACMAFAGLLIYSGQDLKGAEFAAAGLFLPVVGAWISANFWWLILLALISLIGAVVWHYRATVEKILAHLENLVPKTTPSA